MFWGSEPPAREHSDPVTTTSLPVGVLRDARNRKNSAGASYRLALCFYPTVDAAACDIFHPELSARNKLTHPATNVRTAATESPTRGASSSGSDVSSAVTATAPSA